MTWICAIPTEAPITRDNLTGNSCTSLLILIHTISQKSYPEVFHNILNSQFFWLHLHIKLPCKSSVESLIHQKLDSNINMKTTGSYQNHFNGAHLSINLRFLLMSPCNSLSSSLRPSSSSLYDSAHFWCCNMYFIMNMAFGDIKYGENTGSEITNENMFIEFFSPDPEIQNEKIFLRKYRHTLWMLLLTSFCFNIILLWTYQSSRDML